MSGNDDRRRQQGIAPPHDANPFGGMMQLPEQIGEVNIDEKGREVLLGLDNKILRQLKEVMLTKDRNPPDAGALWTEALGILHSMERFVRDGEGKFHIGGIQWEEFLREAEPTFVRLQNWSGIIKAMGDALGLGALLIASLHGDVIKHLNRNDLRTLVPEDQLQMFRIMFESNFLESMKGIFAIPPQEPGQQPTQGFV
jgi:hypothetical protein